jgi:hypothetical protein
LTGPSTRTLNHAIMALIVSVKFEIARKRHWRRVDGRV